MSQDVWGEYVAAAQELDLLQRAGTDGSGPGPDTVRTELVTLRTRLVTQRARLAAAAPGTDLAPAPAEAHAAVAAVGTDPTRALTALRQAAALTDAADALVATAAPAPGGPLSGPWRRNLLVYGPFAGVAFAVNLALYAASGSTTSGLALLWMTGMAGLAYGLGWLVIGLVAGVGVGVRSATLDRTPAVGGAVCAVPLLLAAAALL
ncbi:hypothetical protein GCM10010124_00550 [Pilimelia terevasa]|uniref:Uncharacterized protein n=1 Tax=Pilimelia terevasa TaxID=53372 RepID=A0A8J3BDK4_9ACTN|nr:hypothetical protein [Pilimelia terevasa]GGK11791.1 hypothetical protein GCM10010124_00550 [Pilimelia terevasa]